MKKLLIGLLCYLLTIIVLLFGLGLFNTFIVGGFSVIQFLFGMVGFLIVIRPAYIEWFNRFKKLFKIDD